ncbi:MULTISPECIES: methylated-DNA--[protein]-cysteine S-methyltransferase [Staphylococcus]|uniref:Methylated-DNA--protein-cysteine methyltransferase n=1 Tax=Staphylococcus hsinchuensis TaxID=3051183 RepID=A0ABZ3EEL0_9STAP|nr:MULTISPECIES: methylated-DNA--[protein]-cysteine S-methyltransferase [unclassified Staphylococcus]
MYKTEYQSPVGQITLTSDGKHLTGLWFPKNDITKNDDSQYTHRPQLQIFEKVTAWLDAYFSGNNPEIDFPLQPEGTEFKKQVWDLLLEIPFGQTLSYGELAEKVAVKRNKAKMSAQAVGGAVGSNPISIIIPCHRVVGKDGNLTGYGGGIETKVKLLETEQLDMNQFYIPKKGNKI